MDENRKRMIEFMRQALISIEFDRPDNAKKWIGEAMKEYTAQQSVHPTLGIRATFQAFIYAVKSFVLTAFRRPPQRR